ncbi:hypothetical protein [Caldimonas sp. KR1-144]|uniref:hypothetical protein n=1 Tax=Caldimonas sp. KR1-144 TaxID=3400911 RepID=UPI003C0CF6EC
MTIIEHILFFVSTAGESGCGAQQIFAAVEMHFTSRSVVMAQLTKQGRVFRAGPHHTRWVKYFARAEWAEAWAPVAAELQRQNKEGRSEHVNARRRRRHHERRAEGWTPKKQVWVPKAQRVAQPPPQVEPLKLAPKPAPKQLLPAPVKTPAAKKPAQIVGMDTAKHISCPPCQVERYRVDGPVIGGFASMGVGRYLEEAAA